MDSGLECGQIINMDSGVWTGMWTGYNMDSGLWTLDWNVDWIMTALVFTEYCECSATQWAG